MSSLESPSGIGSVRKGRAIRTSERCPVNFGKPPSRNALDHSPTLASLSSLVTGLAEATLSRAAVLIAVSESSESISNGRDEPAEEKTPGAETHSLVHITDKSLVANLVTRLYSAALDRAPTASESSTQTQALLNGSQTAFHCSGYGHRVNNTASGHRRRRGKPYSITSSARARSVSVRGIPRVFAVLRLITSWNLVGV